VEVRPPKYGAGSDGPAYGIGRGNFPSAKSDTFFAGQVTTKHFQLGRDPKGVGTSLAIEQGNLRVGFLDDQQADENFVGRIVLPDNGGVIGPIDLPFELAVETPCVVKVTPESAPAVDRNVIATLSTAPLKHRWAATRRIVLAHAELAVPAGAQSIPQWVHSVSCCVVDAAVTMFDATGAPLCSLTGPFKDWVRPRLAVLIATAYLDDDVPVVFSYQA